MKKYTFIFIAASLFILTTLFVLFFGGTCCGIKKPTEQIYIKASLLTEDFDKIEKEWKNKKQTGFVVFNKTANKYEFKQNIADILSSKDFIYPLEIYFVEDENIAKTDKIPVVVKNNTLLFGEQKPMILLSYIDDDICNFINKIELGYFKEKPQEINMKLSEVLSENNTKILDFEKEKGCVKTKDKINIAYRILN